MCKHRNALLVYLLAGGLIAGCAENRRRSKGDASTQDTSTADASTTDAVGGTDGTEGADGTIGTDGTDSTDGANGTDGTDETDGTPPAFTVLEIEDDPFNTTLDPCDPGTIKSPGSDIDAAELSSGATIKANLTSCSLSGTTGCENDSASAGNAEGFPDATGSEETGTYTSLNGGLLRCGWEGNAAAEEGDVVEVIEIGGTGGTQVEQYRIRLCTDDGTCSDASAYRSGLSTFPADTLF